MWRKPPVTCHQFIASQTPLQYTTKIPRHCVREKQYTFWSFEHCMHESITSDRIDWGQTTIFVDAADSVQLASLVSPAHEKSTQEDFIITQQLIYVSLRLNALKGNFGDD